MSQLPDNNDPSAGISLLGGDYDDTDLIAAFNSALRRSRNQKIVAMGAFCRAVYNNDKVEYEARIVDVRDDFVQVQFIGFANVQLCYAEELKPSKGEHYRILQEVEAQVCADLYKASTGW